MVRLSNVQFKTEYSKAELEPNEMVPNQMKNRNKPVWNQWFRIRKYDVFEDKWDKTERNRFHTSYF